MLGRFMGVVVSLLLLACSVNLIAASFDCDKASISQEKLICADSELSQLDDSLAIKYKELMLLVADQSALIASQRGWVKERNKCAKQKNCIKDAYQQRIVFLSKCVANGDCYKNKLNNDVGRPVNSNAVSRNNIWYRKTPDGKKIDIYHDSETNDYLLNYLISLKKIDGEYVSTYGGVYFFNGKSVNDEYIRKTFKTLKFIKDGLSGSVGKEIKVSLGDLDPRQPEYCPQSLSHYYKIIHPSGEVDRKSILYVLSEPKTERIDSKCVDTDERQYEVKVVSLQGWVAPLADGSGFFVSSEDYGLVIRFDSDMATGRNIANGRIYVVDTDKLESLFSTKYDAVNYQKTQDNVFGYLNKARKQGD